MRGDRLGNVGIAKIGFLLAELPELRFAIADQILRIATHQVDQLLDFGHARRLLEILPDRGFYSLAAQKSRVSRDLLQRGLCQIVMVILILSPCLPRHTLDSEGWWCIPGVSASFRPFPPAHPAQTGRRPIHRSA